MFNATATHAQQRATAQHYDESCEFMGLFEAGSFDEEVETNARWMGFVRDADGMLQLTAEYVYDDDAHEAGVGWWV